MLISQRVRAEDFATDWYQKKIIEMNLPSETHRKFWEFAVIAKAVEDYFKNEFVRGIGFGCGEEPLFDWFLKRGYRVVATDICPKRFGHVQVDMNNIPHGYRDLYNFCWSCSALEHLGSRKKGFEFIWNSLDCIKPNGLAVHTTEFNYEAQIRTLDAKDICLYTEIDLHDLEYNLREEGHKMRTLDLKRGNEPADLYVDDFPYYQNGMTHLNLVVAEKWVTTSVLLVIEKRG